MSRFPQFIRGLVALASLGTSGAFAQIPDPEMARWAANRIERYEKMRDSASPREWAAAAVSGRMIFIEHLPLAPGETDESRTRHRQEADALLQRAVEAAPKDAFVQWIALYHGNDGARFAAAPSPARAQRMQQLEPDNGMAHMPTVGEAVLVSKDPKAIDAAVARMAKARYDDDHVADHIALLADVVGRHPALAFLPAAHAKDGVAARDYAFESDSTEARLEGMGHQPIESACDAAAQTDAGEHRFADCRTIGRRLMRGAATFRLRLLGFTVLAKCGRLDNEDQALARELAWLQIRSGQLLGELAPAVAYRESRETWLAHKDDVRVARALLENHGLPTKPPVDWQLPAGTG